MECFTEKNWVSLNKLLKLMNIQPNLVLGHVKHIVCGCRIIYVVFMNKGNLKT